MSRRHCHSARRESRQSNCALSNNERHPTARTLPSVDIYSLVPTYCRIAPSHHCHGARRGTRPSNCALSNNERHPTARTLPSVDMYPLVPTYCRIAANLALFSETRFSFPPPRKEHRRESPLVHPKRWPVHPKRRPVHPNLSPTMFEGLRGEFRWHLRSKYRGPKGRSGDTWTEGLLRWPEKGVATGRRRWRSWVCAVS